MSVLYLVLWLASSTMVFGFINAHDQERWPNLCETNREWRKEYFSNMAFSLFVGLFLIVGILVSLFITGFAMDGFNLKMKRVKDG